MFICCRNQFDQITYENKDNLNFESIYCFCEICKKKYLLKFVCKKCSKKLDKSDFNKCQQIFSQPLRNTIHMKDIEKKADLISEKYNTYNNFKKNVLEYIVLYKKKIWLPADHSIIPGLTGAPGVVSNQSNFPSVPVTA